MLNLKTRNTAGAQVQALGSSAWRLTIPPVQHGRYRLAQLDDYHGLRRGAFPWRPPLRLSLRARLSASDLAGTWGFGLWNDPFSFSLGLGGMSQRFPTLPEAAWFFYASPPNYLSFRDDLPAQGLLAATFRSASLPAWVLAPGVLAAPFFLLPGITGLLRRVLRGLVRQDTALLTLDPTSWHSYALEWQEQRVRFYVDDAIVQDTAAAPRGPLALVLWIDNQYAALPPHQGLSFGFLPQTEPAWLEIEQVSLVAE